MDPRSEVLLRQVDYLQGPLLLAGLPADELLGQLAQAHGWSWHAGQQQWLEQHYPGRCSFATTPPAMTWQSAVLFLPKAVGAVRSTMVPRAKVRTTSV